MSMLTEPALYDELIEVLAETADSDRVLSFRLSAPMQARLDRLLERNREGGLTADESAELDAFERFEHLVRLLKARLLEKRGR